LAIPTDLQKNVKQAITLIAFVAIGNLNGIQAWHLTGHDESVHLEMHEQ
jgi:hypothetical protein